MTGPFEDIKIVQGAGDGADNRFGDGAGNEGVRDASGGPEENFGRLVGIELIIWVEAKKVYGPRH